MNLRSFVAKFAVICFTLSFFFLQPAAVPQLEASQVDTGSGEISKMLIAENTNNIIEGEKQATVSLEQAVKIAKEAFTVPEGFDQFSTGFDQSEKMSFWELRWYCTGEPGGNMNVRVNAETGEIWSMHRWIPPAPGQKYQGLPRYSREQMESTAADLAKKLQPERYKETRLQPSQEQGYQPLLQERGPVMYYYNHARFFNGVLFPENGINIEINGDTGEITSFNVNWDDTRDFPPAGGRITQAKAEQIFRQEASPELFYFRPHISGGKEVPLKLVYRLPGPQNQVIIDAITGEILNKDEQYYYDMVGGGGDEQNKSRSKENIELTPLEASEVKEAKNLLPREKALEIAKSAVKVPQDYNLTGSRLEQDYMFKDKKTWRFDWQSGKESIRKWMNISVDASNGELVSFSTDRYYDPLKETEVKFNEDAARKTAEEFIKKMHPAKWQQVVFKGMQPELGPVARPDEKPQPRSYNFAWVRQVNDIRFLENGFHLNVDSATGEITNYRMTWWDVDFPAPKNVMSTEASADKYLQESPMTLVYMRVWPMKDARGPQDAKIHLVYRLDNRNFAMLDAFTGQPLDYEGNVVSPKDKKITFNDMVDHPAQDAVELLARSGVVTGENDKFRPDDATTQAELITMLVKGQRPNFEFRTGSDTGQEPWYQRYYDMAIQMGIIRADEKPDPNAPVTREELARLTVQSMGLYKVARLGDIYALNFQDAGEIAKNLRGHVALSSGLGLIEPAEGKFMPKTVVSRAEAAITLVKLLKSDE